MTDANLAISLLALAVCLQRIVLLWFDYEYILLRAIFDVMVLGFWRYSTTAQASSDFTDPEHPSARPWYLDHGCGGIDARDVNLCMTARVSYAFAIISMSVPLTYTNIPPLCATWLD